MVPSTSERGIILPVESVQLIDGDGLSGRISIFMYVIITHLREEYELRVWTDNEMKVRVNALRVERLPPGGVDAGVLVFEFLIIY